jgi:hypothetical protein
MDEESTKTEVSKHHQLKENETMSIIENENAANNDDHISQKIESTRRRCNTRLSNIAAKARNNKTTGRTNHNKDWTFAEIALIYRNDLTLAQMACELDRSISAIRASRYYHVSMMPEGCEYDKKRKQETAEVTA